MAIAKALMSEPVVRGVVLELTLAEAETLRDLATVVGGHPGYTRRGHVDSIARALVQTGLPSLAYYWRGDREGQVMFTPVEDVRPSPATVANSTDSWADCGCDTDV